MMKNCAKKFWIVVPFVASLISACSVGSTSIVKTCVLPSDQQGTLQGKWQVTPIPIAVDANSNFNSAEMGIVQASASTWNGFFSQSLNIQPLNVGTGTVPTSPQTNPSSGVCNTANVIVQNTTGAYISNSYVVIYKDATWPYTSQPNVYALTTHCHATTGTLTAADGLQYFNATIVELNYQNWFISGKQVPDLQSIITHELGHVLGLGHTCEFGGATHVPDCNSSTLNSGYVGAVMYPTFGFNSSGAAIVRDTLDSNDQGRANCLYGT